jgi:hypothetical protein
MNRLLIATLGLIAGLAFATPTFNVTSADAATSTTSTMAKKKTTHHATHCKATKTHKCPVSHKSASKKKPKKAM